jgi:hypothetical protein
LPWIVSSIGRRHSNKRSVGNSSEDGAFDGLGGRPAIHLLQSATHPSQMKTAAGPATSFLTWCCDLKQKEQ